MPLIKNKLLVILSETAPTAASSSSYSTLNPSNIQGYFLILRPTFQLHHRPLIFVCFRNFGGFFILSLLFCILNLSLNTKKRCLIEIIELFYLVTG
jgi:hypothetical protein